MALTRFSWISIGADLQVEAGGRLRIGRGVRVIRGSFLSVHKGATLVIEDGVWIGPHNIIYCASNIHIGANSRISHFCSVIDHNYDYRQSGNYFLAPKLCEPIWIGSNVWLGAGAVILKGAVINAGCVLGAQTLFGKGTLPPATLCYRSKAGKIVAKKIAASELGMQPLRSGPPADIHAARLSTSPCQ